MFVNVTITDFSELLLFFVSLSYLWPPVTRYRWTLRDVWAIHTVCPVVGVHNLSCECGLHKDESTVVHGFAYTRQVFKVTVSGPVSLEYSQHTESSRFSLQYMLGADVLVAPVVTQQTQSVKVCHVFGMPFTIFIVICDDYHRLPIFYRSVSGDIMLRTLIIHFMTMKAWHCILLPPDYFMTWHRLCCVCDINVVRKWCVKAD